MFQRVAQLSELPEGRGRCFEIDGIDVGLFNVDGAIYAMENRCPHADYPLHEGYLDGHVIICRAHGRDFDVRTGFSPENPDGFPIPCFAVRVDGGDVWVDLDERTNARPPRRTA